MIHNTEMIPQAASDSQLLIVSLKRTSAAHTYSLGLGTHRLVANLPSANI